MSGRRVTSDSVLASSVLPTPAGPSMSTGRPMRAARYTTVATRRLAMYRASRNRCWTSSTDWNPVPPSAAEFRFIVADSGRSATTAAAEDALADLLLGALGFPVPGRLAVRRAAEEVEEALRQARLLLGRRRGRRRRRGDRRRRGHRARRGRGQAGGRRGQIPRGEPRLPPPRLAPPLRGGPAAARGEDFRERVAPARRHPMRDEDVAPGQAR